MKKKSFEKNWGVLYESPVDNLIRVYRAVSTEDEAINILYKDNEFKKIEKSRVFVAYLKQ